MFKPQFTKPALPSLRGIKPQEERTRSLPFGEFVCEVEKLRVVDERGHLAIVVEFCVRDIVSQRAIATTDQQGRQITNEARAGERRMHWFDLKDEFGYGMAEFSGFLGAFGATEETLDEARDIALGEENPLRGQRFIVKRKESVAKKTGNIYAKTYFEAAEEPKAA